MIFVVCCVLCSRVIVVLRVCCVCVCVFASLRLRGSMCSRKDPQCSASSRTAKASAPSVRKGTPPTTPVAVLTDVWPAVLNASLLLHMVILRHQIIHLRLFGVGNVWSVFRYVSDIDLVQRSELSFFSYVFRLSNVRFVLRFQLLFFYVSNCCMFGVLLRFQLPSKFWATSTRRTHTGRRTFEHHHQAISYFVYVSTTFLIRF